MRNDDAGSDDDEEENLEGYAILTYKYIRNHSNEFNTSFLFPLESTVKRIRREWQIEGNLEAEIESNLVFPKGHLKIGNSSTLP